MNREEFMASIAEEAPSGVISPARGAVVGCKRRLDAAPTPRLMTWNPRMAMAVHAYLHRKEGDASNAELLVPARGAQLSPSLSRRRMGCAGRRAACCESSLVILNVSCVCRYLMLGTRDGSRDFEVALTAKKRLLRLLIRSHSEKKRASRPAGASLIDFKAA